MNRRLLYLTLALLVCIACASAAIPTYPFPTAGVTLPAGEATLPTAAVTTAPIVTQAGNQLQVVTTAIDPPVLMISPSSVAI